MNQPKTSKAEATKRPWIAKLGPFDHDNGGARPIMSSENADGEWHRIAMVDSVAPRKRSTPYDAPDAERDANAALIVQAVNEYEALNAVAEAAVKTLAAFEAGVFVRNTEKDSDPQWAIKLLPHLSALGAMKSHTDALAALRAKEAQ